MKMTYEGTGHLLRGGLAIVLLPLATSCALATAVVGEKTVGEQFREVMHRIDEGCKARGEGPYLDPKSPGYAQKSRYTDCDILKLKPYDPLATEEGRFAHALKLPPPHDKPEDVYRPGMSGGEYFKALCAANTGEVIFKSVENIESVVQLRPYRLISTASGSFASYAIKNTSPAGQFASPTYFEYLLSPMGKYRYVELSESYVLPRYDLFFREPHGMPFSRVSINLGAEKKQVREAADYTFIPLTKPEARYGFTWRQIEFPGAYEHGIIGLQLLVVDLSNREVMAYRTDLFRYYFDANKLQQQAMASTGCRLVPPTLVEGRTLLYKVLKPISTKE